MKQNINITLRNLFSLFNLMLISFLCFSLVSVQTGAVAAQNINFERPDTSINNPSNKILENNLSGRDSFIVIPIVEFHEAKDYALGEDSIIDPNLPEINPIMPEIEIQVPPYGLHNPSEDNPGDNGDDENSNPNDNSNPNSDPNGNNEDTQQYTEEETQDKIDEAKVSCNNDADDAVDEAVIALTQSQQNFDLDDINNARDDLSSAKKLISDARALFSEGKYDDAVAKLDRAQNNCEEIVDDLETRDYSSSQSTSFASDYSGYASSQDRTSSSSQEQADNSGEMTLIRSQIPLTEEPVNNSRGANAFFIGSIIIVSLLIAIELGVLGYHFLHKKEDDEEFIQFIK